MWHRQRYQGENRDNGESQPSQNTPHPPRSPFSFLLKTQNLINSAQWHWESGGVIKLFHLVLRGQQEVSREHGSGGVSDPHLLLCSAGEESSKRLWAPKEQSSVSAHADIFLHVISKENHDALCSLCTYHSRLLLKGQQCTMGQDVGFIFFFCCTKPIYIDNEMSKLTKSFFGKK